MHYHVCKPVVNHLCALLEDKDFKQLLQIEYKLIEKKNMATQNATSVPLV